MLTAFFGGLMISGCDELLDESGDPRLDDSTIVAGLKNALEVGTDTAVSRLNRTDGYFRDQAVKILLPEDVRAATQYVDQTLEGNAALELAAGVLLGDYSELTDQLELQINRAAEDAAGTAGPIFFDAIAGISIRQGRDILFAGQDSAAATAFLQSETRRPLFNEYQPRMDSVLMALNVKNTYTELTTTYNDLLDVAANFNLAADAPAIETDLATYATNKGLDGLFFKVEQEEKDIRKDPLARVNNLLEEVFGELD
jgi:hypothetical protein